MTVRLALMTEPQQGLSYAEIAALARTAEEAGLEAFFRSDHFASFPGPAGEPTTDAWSTLAGLARETTRIRIGSLVSPITFRIPGVFAKQVATVDGDGNLVIDRDDLIAAARGITLEGGATGTVEFLDNGDRDIAVGAVNRIDRVTNGALEQIQ